MDDRIEEYITGDSYSLKCKLPECSWTTYGERTENFMDEIQQDVEDHLKWHDHLKIESLRPLTDFDKILLQKYVTDKNKES